MSGATATAESSKTTTDTTHTNDIHNPTSNKSIDHNDINLTMYNPEATVNGPILQSINPTANKYSMNGVQHSNNNSISKNETQSHQQPLELPQQHSLPTYSSFTATNQLNETTPQSQQRSVGQPSQIRRVYSADSSNRLNFNNNTASNTASNKSQLKEPKVKRKYKTKHRKINKTHPEFELTYDMMLGIRTTVGKTEAIHASHAHNDTELSDSDSEDDTITTQKFGFAAKKPKTTNLNKKFQEEISLRFPGKGSTYTPAHTMRDFKFKSYCPDVFRSIRAIFHLQPDDYLMNICGNFQYLEFISNSKSGSFFFYSHDRRFMIKTISKQESKFLRLILPQYYSYVKSQPNTLLTRFYGMHRVKPHKKMLRRFLIMQSIFYTAEPSIYIHQTFDIKGSTLGRNATEREKASGNPVYKDNDFEEFGTRIKITGDKKQQLIQQLTDDCKFLQQLEIMDYSLLLGIHYRAREQTDEALDAITEDETQHSTDESVLQHTRQASAVTQNTVTNARASSTPQYTATSPNSKQLQQRNSMPEIPHTRSQHDSDIDTETHQFTNLKVATNSPSTKPALVTPSHSTDMDQVHSGLLTPHGSSTVARTPQNNRGSIEPIHSPQRTSIRGQHYGLPKRYDQIKKAADINFHPPAFDPLPDTDTKPTELKHRQSSMDSSALTSPVIQPTDSNLHTPTHNSEKLTVIATQNGKETVEAVPTVEDVISEIHQHHHNDHTHSAVHHDDNEPTTDKQQNLFRIHSDSLYSNGGTDEFSISSDDNTEVYYLGIIDILTQYNLKKKFEHTFKMVTHKSMEISCAPPDQYADRFLKFVTKHIGYHKPTPDN